MYVCMHICMYVCICSRINFVDMHVCILFDIFHVHVLDSNRNIYIYISTQKKRRRKETGEKK